MVYDFGNQPKVTTDPLAVEALHRSERRQKWECLVHRRIRQLGISIRQVERLSNLKHPKVARMIKGQLDPTIDECIAIARVLRLPISECVGLLWDVDVRDPITSSPDKAQDCESLGSVQLTTPPNRRYQVLFSSCFVATRIGMFPHWDVLFSLCPESLRRIIGPSRLERPVVFLPGTVVLGCPRDSFFYLEDSARRGGYPPGEISKPPSILQRRDGVYECSILTRLGTRIRAVNLATRLATSYRMNDVDIIGELRAHAGIHLRTIQALSTVSRALIFSEMARQRPHR